MMSVLDVLDSHMYIAWTILCMYVCMYVCMLVESYNR